MQGRYTKSTHSIRTVKVTVDTDLGDYGTRSSTSKRVLPEDLHEIMMHATVSSSSTTCRLRTLAVYSCSSAYMCCNFTQYTSEPEVQRT